MANQDTHSPKRKNPGGGNSAPHRELQESKATLKISFFTAHAHVLILLLANKGTPLRVIAGELGITERSVQGIVSDLEKGGILKREKVGRINSYAINLKAHLLNDRENHRLVDELVQFLSRKENRAPNSNANYHDNENREHSPRRKLLVSLR